MNRAPAALDCSVEALLKREDIWYGWSLIARRRLLERVTSLFAEAQAAASDPSRLGKTEERFYRVRDELWGPYIHPDLRKFFLSIQNIWMGHGDSGEFKLREGYWKRSNDPASPSPGTDDCRSVTNLLHEVDCAFEERSIAGIVGNQARAALQRVLGWLSSFSPTSRLRGDLARRGA